MLEAEAVLLTQIFACGARNDSFLVLVALGRKSREWFLMNAIASMVSPFPLISCKPHTRENPSLKGAHLIAKPLPSNRHLQQEPGDGEDARRLSAEQQPML